MMIYDGVTNETERADFFREKLLTYFKVQSKIKSKWRL